MPGWKPVYNLTKSMSEFELLEMCPKPWRYRSARSLNSLPFQGKDISYDGGGFVADLGYNSWQALDVISGLENNNWLDDKTAAVFAEFTVFEPSTSLFSHAKYLFERLTTGGTHARMNVKTLVLYSSSDQNFQSFFQVCQLMLMLMILFFLFVEIGKIYRQGRNYPKQFWNWMELVQITSAVAAIVMFFFKEKYTSDFVQNVQNNPYETSSIDYIVLWSDLEIYLLSLVIFVVTIKFLRLIRFNRSICQMTGTLVRSAKSMASFFILFVAVLLAFTQLGFLAFGGTVSAYSSFFQAMRAVLQMLLGGEMHFYELKSVDGFIGPMFTFVYMLSMTMILLNMFLAILNDSYEETRELENEDDFADADLCEFMTQYFKNSFNVLSNEIANLGKKLFSIAQNYIKEKRPPQEKEYKKVPIEENGVILKQDENDSKEECYLASLESIDDLLDESDKETLEELKSSMSELRRSLLSLKIDEAVHREEFNQQASSKWDSPSPESQINQDNPTKAHSIFDRPPDYFSLFDRPVGPVFNANLSVGYRNGHYSPYSSSRYLHHNNTTQNNNTTLSSSEEDEELSTENTALLAGQNANDEQSTTITMEKESVL